MRRRVYYLRYSELDRMRWVTLMKDPSGKVVLITGASSGIGKSCADALVMRNDRIYGTSRRPVQEKSPYPMIKMDVREDGEVRDAIRHVIDREGRIDVLINNAGITLTGAVEDTSLEEARSLFETNFFGILRVLRAVIPFMRQQGGGLVINMSSIGGFVGLPFQGLYCASKFALEGMSEALRMEVKPFNIDVVLLEPGDIRTDIRSKGIQTEVGAPYRDQFEKTLKIVVDNEERGADPHLVARKVIEIIEKETPGVRYVAGIVSQKSTVLVKRLLPSSVFLKLISSYYGIKQ
jgi:NAD(P)-dependent dehydrogenase (short-subunit alcohol dehydrogenase family)